MTFEELKVGVGNDGVLAGVFGHPIPSDQIEGTVLALLESEYSAPAAIVHSLRVQLDQAMTKIDEADRALANHIKTPLAPSRPSAFGKLGQTLGKVPIIRNLRESKMLGRVFGGKDRTSAAAEARARVRKSLEQRVNDARDRAQHIREKLDTQIERAEEDAEKHAQMVQARKADLVAIFTAEHNSWKRRSERLCN